MLFPSVLLQLPFWYRSDDVVGAVGAVICTVQCIILIASAVGNSISSSLQAFHLLPHRPYYSLRPGKTDIRY